MNVSRPVLNHRCRRREPDWTVVVKVGDHVAVVHFNNRKAAAKFSKRMRKAARDAR